MISDNSASGRAPLDNLITELSQTQQYKSIKNSLSNESEPTIDEWNSTTKKITELWGKVPDLLVLQIVRDFLTTTEYVFIEGAISIVNRLLATSDELWIEADRITTFAAKFDDSGEPFDEVYLDILFDLHYTVGSAGGLPVRESHGAKVKRYNDTYQAAKKLQKLLLSDPDYQYANGMFNLSTQTLELVSSDLAALNPNLQLPIPYDKGRSLNYRIFNYLSDEPIVKEILTALEDRYKKEPRRRYQGRKRPTRQRELTHELREWFREYADKPYEELCKETARAILLPEFEKCPTFLKYGRCENCGAILVDDPLR